MATAQDWRITAYFEATTAIAAFDRANEEPVQPADAPTLSQAEILREYWAAARAARAAAGAMVQAVLRESMSWDEVAEVLGLTDGDSAQRELAPDLEAAQERLTARLHGDSSR